MEWTEIFLVLLVSHLAGDFVLQTDWQATNKRGGLGPDPVARRALALHGVTYGLAFIPAFVWLAGEIGAAVFGVAALIVLPHLVQDDGRVVSSYMAQVKRTDVNEDSLLYVAVDQSFHAIALFLVALVATG